MPWTRRQVRYLLSKVSPLSGDQKTKMVGELHADPAMGHKKKGSTALQKKPAVESESHTYNWRSRENIRRGKKIS